MVSLDPLAYVATLWTFCVSYPIITPRISAFFATIHLLLMLV